MCKHQTSGAGRICKFQQWDRDFQGADHALHVALLRPASTGHQCDGWQHTVSGYWYQSRAEWWNRAGWLLVLLDTAGRVVP